MAAPTRNLADLIAEKTDALIAATLDALPDIVASAPSLQAAAVRTAALLKELGALVAEYQVARAGVDVVAGLPAAATFAVDTETLIDSLAGIISAELDVELSRALEIVRRALGTAPLVADAQTMALAKTIREIFDKAIGEGMTVRAFQKAGAELLGTSRSSLEAEFRTELQRRYSSKATELFKAASGGQPQFLQWLAIMDDRARPTHRAMHKYIAEANDVTWSIWIPPAGYSCRCIRIAIPYQRAIRMGILAYGPDGKGLVMTKGPRPFGDPPRTVVDPKTKKILIVRPDPGFDGRASVAA